MDIFINPSMVRNRKRRVPITTEKLDILIRMKNAGEKVSSIASALDVTVQTVYAIFGKMHMQDEINGRYGDILKKTGPKPNEANQNLLHVAEVVQMDNTLTQKGMQDKLRSMDVILSQPSISNALKKLKITRKRLKLKSEKVISPEVINKRMIYARELMKIPDSKLYFLDETGLNLHSMSSYGYSPKNIDAVALVPANRGRNISILSLICNRSIVKTKIIEGPYNSESFCCFINSVYDENLLPHDAFIVMDNVKFHKSSIVVASLNEKKMMYKYLPPYSPQLNPIEEMFSILKARYFKIRPIPRTSACIRMYVERVIEDMNSDRNLNMANLYVDMRRYVDKAFIGELF